MKKKLILLILIVIYILGTQSCMVFGPLTLRAFPTARLCFNISDIYGPGSSFDDPAGAQAGFIYPVAYFGDYMSLRPEIGISMAGGKYNDNGLKGRVNLLYVNLPLILRYQTKNGFFGEAGLQPGLLLSAKDKYEGITDNFMGHMNKFDLSVPVGIGYVFRNNFGIGLRVIPGLNDITRDEDVKERNFVMALGVTYTFKKK